MNIIRKQDPAEFSIIATDYANREDLYQDYKALGGSDTGLLGVITSCTVNHNMERQEIGVFEKGAHKLDQIPDASAPGTVLPKMIDINLSFNPIHERTVGWDSTGDPLDSSFPYGAILKAPTDAEAGQKFNERIDAILKDEEKRDQSQAMIDNAKARYSGMFGEARRKRDEKRLTEGKIKSESAREYIAGTYAGDVSDAYGEGGISSREAGAMTGFVETLKGSD
jgi:hypothetical protein